MSTDSQESQILEWLLAGNALTPLEALDRFGSLRLGARIHGLRGRGHDIQMRMVERNGKRFAEYSMAQKKRPGREYRAFDASVADGQRQGDWVGL